MSTPCSSIHSHADPSWYWSTVCRPKTLYLFICLSYPSLSKPQSYAPVVPLIHHLSINSSPNLSTTASRPCSFYTGEWYGYCCSRSRLKYPDIFSWRTEAIDIAYPPTRRTFVCLVKMSCQLLDGGHRIRWSQWRWWWLNVSSHTVVSLKYVMVPNFGLGLNHCTARLTRMFQSRCHGNQRQKYFSQKMTK